MWHCQWHCAVILCLWHRVGHGSALLLEEHSLFTFRDAPLRWLVLIDVRFTALCGLEPDIALGSRRANNGHIHAIVRGIDEGIIPLMRQ
jgi:hypothetical protein